MPSKLFSFVSVSLVTLYSLLCVTHSFAADVYVSVSGNDSWSGTSAIAANDGIHGPFATLEKARDAVRELRRSEPKRTTPIVVQMEEGRYDLNRPFVLTPDDSGTPLSPTIFRGSTEADKVILSGGRTITGWKKVAPGRWETTIPQVAEGTWYFEQLYVNDQRRFRPMLPKEGYYVIAGTARPMEGSYRSDRFYYDDVPFDPNWKNPGDVEVQTFHYWTMDHFRVKAIDTTRKHVVFTSPPPGWDMAHTHAGTPYRIVNVYESLSEPGQWYLDRKTGVLTYLSWPNEDLNQCPVVAPVISKIVSLEGEPESGKYVENVQFDNLTFAHSAWTMPQEGAGYPQAAAYLDGAVTLVGAKYCSIKNCFVRHTGNYGIDFNEGCSHCDLVHSELIDLGGGGIKIGGNKINGEEDSRKWASHCNVEECYIAHGGRVHPESVGIWLGHAAHCEVKHNEVFDFYYSAISAGWCWKPGFSPARFNRIQGNRLHKIGQGVINDMGGIYLLGESPGTVVSFNEISDVNRMDYGGWAIYLDASIKDVLVEHNLSYDTEDSGINQNFGSDNIVRRNIFTFGRNGQLRMSAPEKSGKITFEENIFYWSTPELVEEYGFDVEKAVMKGNTYWNTHGPEAIVFPGERTFDQWKAFEPDAQVADPGFVDPENNNFAFKQPGRMAGLTYGIEDHGLAVYQPGRRHVPIYAGNIPPVPVAFTPTPRRFDSLEGVVIDEDFEILAVGDGIPRFLSETAGGSVIAVTDETAAAGSAKSLKVFKGAHVRNPWDPQISQFFKYRGGVFSGSFDLRLDDGASMVFECRDWPHRDETRSRFRSEYVTGPYFQVRPDGMLTSHNVELFPMPYRQWIHFEFRIQLPENADDTESGKTFSLTVTLSGEKPRVFDKIACPKQIQGIDWISFHTFGNANSVYYIDNLKVW